MTPLETYLRGVTTGLPRAARAIVRAELEGHLEHRAIELQVLGLSAEEAMTRALLEIGAVSQVQRSMFGLYALPRVLRQAFLIALIAWYCASPLSPVTARVQATAVKNATGQIVSVQLEPFAFSSALESFGVNPRMIDQHLPSSFGIGHAWTANAKTPFKGLMGVYPLEWREAKRFLCALGRDIQLEPDPRAIVFRLESPGFTWRLQLDLQPGDAERWRASLQTQDLECVP